MTQASNVNYEKTGLKVGLEIHQQLDTSAKLFCSCKPGLFKEEPEITFLRGLRPTQSELGQVDQAAFFEFQKGVKICYEANDETSCLVEMDEEPPHPLNNEAVDIVLTVALMMQADPVEEIHVMRKTVIDGSNTTGFQRTCVIALNGQVKVGEKVIPIQHASLEEDAARKMDEKGNTIRYRIDRLGIPLIEVATAPVIRTPKEAEEVAYALGGLFRATGKVMRGLGTIRQDINISIPSGALVEIKGLQELELVSLVVEYEVQRQLNLIEIASELDRRTVKEQDLKNEFVDVSEVFAQTSCKVIRKALDKRQQVLAVKLSRFGGLLGKELMLGVRLGTEMADRARFWGRVGGIFHTDELPAYGITAEELEKLRNAAEAGHEDAVVFVADTPENCRDALKAVVDRAREALKGVPEETRGPNPDGTSRYMRPRPGAARMYPETDIPPTLITEEHISRIRAELPELPEQRFKRLMREYGLNEKLAKQILSSEHGGLFETIAKDSGVSPTLIAVFLTETLKALKRDGVPIDSISDACIGDIFKSLGSGEITKESVADVAVWLAKNEERTVADAIAGLGLKTVSEGELRAVIKGIVAENHRLIEDKGEASFGPLMGIVMKSMRGKADASKVSRLLRQELKDALK